MGIHKCANNIGTAIVSLLVGFVQDLTYYDGDPTDNHSDLMNEYNGVMIFYLALGCGSSLLVIIFWFIDKVKLKGWLQADKKERDRRLNQLMEQKEIQEIQEIEKQQEQEQQLQLQSQQEQLSYSMTNNSNINNRHNNSNQSSPLPNVEEYLKITGNQLLTKKSYLYPGIYCFWLILAWVAFFAFALMPVYLQQYQTN